MRVYVSILGAMNYRYAAIAKSKRHASQIIRDFVNAVDLCPWHDYSASEIMVIPVTNQHDFKVVNFILADGSSRLNPRLLADERLFLLSKRRG